MHGRSLIGIASALIGKPQKFLGWPPAHLSIFFSPSLSVFPSNSDNSTTQFQPCRASIKEKIRASPGSELFEGLLSVLGSSGSRDAERASGNGRANSERCGTDGGGADHGGAAGGGAEEGGGLHDS